MLLQLSRALASGRVRRNLMAFDWTSSVAVLGYGVFMHSTLAIASGLLGMVFSWYRPVDRLAGRMRAAIRRRALAPAHQPEGGCAAMGFPHAAVAPAVVITIDQAMGVAGQTIFDPACTFGALPFAGQRSTRHHRDMESSVLIVRDGVHLTTGISTAPRNGGINAGDACAAANSADA